MNPRSIDEPVRGTKKQKTHSAPYGRTVQIQKKNLSSITRNRNEQKARETLGRDNRHRSGGLQMGKRTMISRGEHSICSELKDPSRKKSHTDLTEGKEWTNMSHGRATKINAEREEAGSSIRGNVYRKKVREPSPFVGGRKATLKLKRGDGDRYSPSMANRPAKGARSVSEKRGGGEGR